MKNILAVLILIPSLAFAESLVYLSKTPTVSTVKMQGPQAFVEVAGVKVDQPIAVATDDGKGAPVWAVLVKDADKAKIEKDAAYLGKGLNEVKAKDRATYDKLTVADQPIQTFMGYDAMTGDATSSIKIPIKEEVIVK